jgi:hypothetical protein
MDRSTYVKQKRFITKLMKSIERRIIEKQREVFKNNTNEKGYFNRPEDNLLEIFSNWKEIENELRKGKGNELENKFLAIHSSSALCVNNFAPFKGSKNEISFYGNANFEKATFEMELSTKISKPNLDLFLENKNIMIGIESKFTEYFKKNINHTKDNLCKYYKRKELSYLPDKFNSLLLDYINSTDEMYLDVAQLIKHSIGLINNKGQKNAVLIYIYWQPTNWEDFEICKKHSEEVNLFSDKMSLFQDVISFKYLSYSDLWREYENNEILKEHIEKVKTRYQFELKC